MGDTQLESCDAYHPVSAAGIRQFEVGDELVLITAPGEQSAGTRHSDRRCVTLNASGSAIWRLCDGNRSVDDIVEQLASEFSVDRDVISQQVGTAVDSLRKQGFLARPGRDFIERPSTVFVIGVEDRTYFWWQVAIFLESIQGKLPFGWRPFIVVCNNHEPLSHELRHILETYGAEFVCTTNHGNANPAELGSERDRFYVAFNKIEALAMAGSHVDKSELIFLLDSDIFLYGELDLEIMPTGCALARNWHVEKDIFFTTVAANENRGVDLQKLLNSIGCRRDFPPGAVNIFVSGEVAKNQKFTGDCFRFAQAVLLLARIAGAPHWWLAEMPCYGLAFAANDVEHELLERKQLQVSHGNESKIAEGTFYHYYNDRNEGDEYGAFYKSRWCKQDYKGSNFLELDMTEFIKNASSDHERYFFELAHAAKERLDV